MIKGCQYRIKDSEKYTQDNGVSREANTICYKKGHELVKRLEYYDVLKEIVVLDFDAFKVILFKCDWVGNGKNDVKV